MLCIFLETIIYLYTWIYSVFRWFLKKLDFFNSYIKHMVQNKKKINQRATYDISRYHVWCTYLFTWWWNNKMFLSSSTDIQIQMAVFLFQFFHKLSIKISQHWLAISIWKFNLLQKIVKYLGNVWTTIIQVDSSFRIWNAIFNTWNWSFVVSNINYTSKSYLKK